MLLLFAICSFGQSEQLKSFYSLPSLDTITTKHFPDNLKRIDSLNNDNYFFIDEYKEEFGFFFVKRVQDKWIVYDFDSFVSRTSNSNISKIEEETEEYLSIQTFRSPSGGCATAYGILFFLDVNQVRRVDFSNYYMEECYDSKGEVSHFAECKATITIKNKLVQIQSPKRSNDGLYCIGNSEYKIEEEGFVKTKYYFENTDRLLPLICLDKTICTGMEFENLKKEFSNAIFKEVPLYKYGHDSDRIGYEICANGEILFFVVVSDNLVTSISVISSKYDLNGFHTAMTVEEIFEKNPNSKIYVDLISDWEYIFLKDERIRLNFKTDKMNRIGVYDFDPEDAANGIKRKSAKIDFVETF
nr:hypothetical protein [Allomuricauda sp.]